MKTLAALEQQRAYECRLTPDRALATLDEAEEFLEDRGLLTRTGDSALPSLFEACHEEPYAREKAGFGQWPARKFPWFGRLGTRGHLLLAVHRGKSLLVTGAVADILDPICRAELGRIEAADDEEPAGISRTRNRAAATTRGRRWVTSSAPACTPPSSRRSASWAAGSPGAGTGTTTWSTPLVRAGRLIRVDGHVASA